MSHRRTPVQFCEDMMSELLERLLEQAQALSASERAALAQRLMLDAEPVDAHWEAAWAAECERRLKDVQAGAATTAPWDEVRQRLFRR